MSCRAAAVDRQVRVCVSIVFGNERRRRTERARESEGQHVCLKRSLCVATCVHYNKCHKIYEETKDERKTIHARTMNREERKVNKRSNENNNAEREMCSSNQQAKNRNDVFSEIAPSMKYMYIYMFVCIERDTREKKSVGTTLFFLFGFSVKMRRIFVFVTTTVRRE